MYRPSVRFFAIFLFSLVFNPLLVSQQSFVATAFTSHPEILSYSSVSRKTIDLAGTWDFSIDEGLTWKEIGVPSALDYVGKVTYQRKFDIAPQELTNNSYKLVSYGINYSAEIFINELFIGKHEGGTTSFDFPIPESVLQVGGENIIRIVVDNTLNARSTLPLKQQIGGWKNYNSIHRDLFLVGTPRVWIDEMAVGLDGIDPKGARLTVAATIGAREFKELIPQGTTSPGSMVFQIEVLEKNTGSVAGKSAVLPLAPEQNKDVLFRAPLTIAGLKLWTLDAPELYEVRAVISVIQGKNSTLIDERRLTTGFRTLSKNGKTLLLNGVSLPIKAVAWIEQSREHGTALTYEEMERDVALMKNLGANTIRFAFHPPHPNMLNLCDRYGLFAMVEIPVVEVPADIFAREEFQSLTENILREMIARDRHHPSVIAWGLGDGFESVDQRSIEFIRQLNEKSKSLDDRLTYYASRTADDLETSLLVDIAGVSLMTQDLKSFKATLSEWKKNHPDQLVFVTRYGKAIEQGNRNGYSDPMSQEAQARYLLQRYDIIKDANIMGGCVWAFADWRGDVPLMTVHLSDAYLHTSGIVEYSREKKIAYDIVRSMFLGEKIAAFPIGTHNPTSPVIYVLLGLVMLILFAWVLNSNRRFRESVSRAFMRPYNFFSDIRDQRIQSNAHTLLLALIVAVTYAIICSSILYHFRTNGVVDYVLSHFITSSDVKEFIIFLAWNPLLCIGNITAVTLATMFFVVIGIQVGSWFIRTRVYLFHSYSVGIWSTLPMVIFILVGMILYRVMETETYVIPVMIFFALINIWVLLRTLKGISIIYDVFPPKLYAVALVVVLIAVGIWYAYVDHVSSTTAYARFLISTIFPSAQ